MAGYLRKLGTLLSDYDASRILLRLRFGGFLHDRGWFQSAALHRPVDLMNQPVPWVSYAFTLFIEPRLSKDMNVFEFGAGNSTLYYANRVNSVEAVEHNESWYRQILRDLPPNVDLYLIALNQGGDYSRAALRSGRKFDLIIVDGEDRVDCLKHSPDALTAGGVIVLDDSERADYGDGTAYLEQLGFKRIDFWGMSPGHIEQKCTTIFYRQPNCLNI